MAIDTVRPFDNEESLKIIREKILNPLSEFVKDNLKPNLEKAQSDILSTYKEVGLDTASKELTFTTHDGSSKKIDLETIIPPEFEGISISDGKGGSATKIKSLTIDNATVQSAGGETHLDFDWGHLVPMHQDRVEVKIGSAAAQKINQLIFTGNEGKLSVSGDTLNFEIPQDPLEFKAKVDDGTGSGEEKAITKILLEGNTGSSVVTDTGELKITLPTSGPGGTGGNFQGFFSNLGDLESEITSPVNGKTFAFVKDATLGDRYYTPYMYVGGAWTEVPVDPSITYEPIQSSGRMGIFSIKPDNRISIDKYGQLDLGRLGDGHFVGFFETQDALDAACPQPTLDKSFAYVKITATEVYSGKRYIIKKDGTRGWVSVTPYGMISATTKNESGDIKVAEPVFGIEKNDAISVDGGIITIKEAQPSLLTVKAKEKEDGEELSVKVDTLHFVSGIYVDLDAQTKTATIHHPQRTIHYDDKFESDHKSTIFLGHLFYDLNSATWMGHSPGADSTKPAWTKIIHRGMSGEVKDLSFRKPAKAPLALPDVYQDSQYWAYSGESYSESASDIGFDASYKDKGVYVTTIARKTETDTELAPKNRIQVAYIEDDNSEIHIRKTNPDATGHGSPWNDWIKVSLSQADIDKHNSDPAAHKEQNRFYKVVTTNTTYKNLLAANGNIYDKENSTMPVADNRGLPTKSTGFFQIPYNGFFKFSGRIEIDNASASQGIWYKGVWTLRVKRVRKGVETILDSFVYEHGKQAEKYPGMSFKTSSTQMEKGDDVYFNLTFLGDGNIEDNAPNANFIPWRTYFVLEDAVTDAGSRIAETFRKTVGMFYSYGTGINTHPTNLDNPSTHPRVYGVHVDLSSKDMTKA